MYLDMLKVCWFYHNLAFCCSSFIFFSFTPNSKVTYVYLDYLVNEKLISSTTFRIFFIFWKFFLSDYDLRRKTKFGSKQYLVRFFKKLSSKFFFNFYKIKLFSGKSDSFVIKHINPIRTRVYLCQFAFNCNTLSTMTTTSTPSPPKVHLECQI